jgi:acetylornithine aminotransferase
MRPGDHGSTFGGQPLAAAAANAVLAVMEREDVPARAERAGARLVSRLDAMPEVAAVRGLGLLLAAELATGVDAKAAANAALDAGLVVNAVTPTALRFAPPLLVSDDEIDEAMAILAAVLTSVAATAGADPGSS